MITNFLIKFYCCFYSKISICIIHDLSLINDVYNSPNSTYMTRLPKKFTIYIGHGQYFISLASFSFGFCIYILRGFRKLVIAFFTSKNTPNLVNLS